jgi:hypothetical protein
MSLLSYFLDVSSLNLAALYAPPFFCPKPDYGGRLAAIF